MTSESCDIYCFDEQKVNQIQNELSVLDIPAITGLFKALADETRLKVAYALTKEELCVCDVANILGSSVATASHHLRKLKHSNIASFRKEGKMAFYKIHDPMMAELIQSAFNHQEEVAK